MFELRLNNKTIHLKWGTWAMREFCQRNNITIDKYFELLGKTQFDIDLIVQLVFIGYKSACISLKIPIDYTEDETCDWIDEMGTIFSSEGQLIDYIKYIIESTVNSVKTTTTEEKKKSNEPKLG
jgi:hypothetical protein